MSRIERHFADIGYMDVLAGQDTPLHRLDPRAKLLTTLAFVICVVSFGRYQISALLPFFLYPAFLIARGNLPLGYIVRKLVIVSPFAVMVGIFNPLLDKEALFSIAGLTISGGWVSFASILVRFTLTVGAALTLIAVTGFNSVCMAIERLGAPQVFALQLLFLYRYLFVLVEEGARMVRARALRVFNGRGTGLKAYGSLLGHFLLRALDRAQRIHSAMWCRGFDGSIRVFRPLSFGSRELFFVTGWVSLFVIARLVNLPAALGGLIMELLP